MENVVQPPIHSQAATERRCGVVLCRCYRPLVNGDWVDKADNGCHCSNRMAPATTILEE